MSFLHIFQKSKYLLKEFLRFISDPNFLGSHEFCGD